MKILYWTEQVTPYIGGVELITDDFLAALTGSGHEVTVIAGKEQLTLDGPNVPGTDVPVHYFLSAKRCGTIGSRRSYPSRDG